MWRQPLIGYIPEMSQAVTGNIRLIKMPEAVFGYYIREISQAVLGDYISEEIFQAIVGSYLYLETVAGDHMKIIS